MRPGAIASFFSAGFILVACNRHAPEQGRHAPVARSEPGPAPSASEQPEADPRTTCERVNARPPESDRPNQAERPSLRDCDAEALYYGIGRPNDFVEARKCAYAQLDGPGAPVFGGAAILMMIYANGKAVPRDLDLAATFACRVGGAEAELQGRLYQIDALRTGPKPESELDLCDHATSGFMNGWCAGHRERIASVAKGARKKRAMDGLPKSELGALERAARAFSEARTHNEVDLAGTMRAVFMIEEEANLEDAYVSGLEELKTAPLPPKDAGANAAESELDRVYARVMTCRDLEEGAKLGVSTITRAGIQRTERVWFEYREAWMKLAAKVRPEMRRDAWRARITRERIGMLKQLSVGCGSP